jgi:hypothetical protein
MSTDQQRQQAAKKRGPVKDKRQVAKEKRQDAEVDRHASAGQLTAESLRGEQCTAAQDEFVHLKERMRCLEQHLSQVEAYVLKIAEETHVVIQKVHPMHAEQQQGIATATIKARQMSQDAPQMVDVARQMRRQREE